MEVSINDKELQHELQRSNFKIIVVSSTDRQDKGKLFKIKEEDIISIEEGIESLCIWWRWYNPLEGKNMTNSNHFKEFVLI